MSAMRNESGVIELRVDARHGGEKFEIIFPADRKKAVSKAMEHALILLDDKKKS